MSYPEKFYPCAGEAHQNINGADHCSLCAPRWNEVPAHEALSTPARWVLDALAFLPMLRGPGMPDDVHEAAQELERMGLASFGECIERHSWGESACMAVYLTDDGRAALAMIAAAAKPRKRARAGKAKAK